MSKNETLKILGTKAKVALEVFNFAYFELFWNSPKLDKVLLQSLYGAVEALKELLPEFEEGEAVMVVKQ